MAIAAPLAAQNNAPSAYPPASADRVAIQMSIPAIPATARAILPAGTPVVVTLDQQLSSATSKVGDKFQVTVSNDVVDGATVVIPRGAIGHGEVTFTTRRGGFGKAGIIGIALRDLQLGDRKVALDGRYREEGKNRNGATVATWFAVGVFSGFIKGDQGAIPKGRELKARTGEAIAYTPGSLPPSVPVNGPEPAFPAGDPPSDTSNPATSTNDSTRLSQEQPVSSETITTKGEQE